MAYLRGQMLYRHKYKWTAPADHDNPKVRSGKEAKELNRSEGYEMLDFINALADSWKWGETSINEYNGLEEIIKNKVPSHIRDRKEIKKWIEEYFKSKG